MALPDLHTKMAKKVAQLTKVIFHLNTVNEDAQLEKDAMRAQHVREIDELSADAATKIEAIQAQLKDRKDQMNLEAKMTQMARKHQDEKSQAQAEFARYKREMLARDEAVVGEYQDKVGVLREEITVVKAQSQEAMRRFAESLDEMKKSRSNQAEDSAAEMRLLREKHQREVDDLVKTSNAKYHQMLAEQMTAQDLLREQMQEREEAVRAAAKAEFEQETGRLRAELRAEQQTTLLAQEKDFERKLKDCRDGLLGKLEKASSDKADLERELAALQEATSQGNGEAEAIQKQLLRQHVSQQERMIACGSKCKCETSAARAWMAAILGPCAVISSMPIARTWCAGCCKLAALRRAPASWEQGRKRASKC